MTPLVSVLVFIFAVGAIGGIEQVNQGIHRPANIHYSEMSPEQERTEWRDICIDEDPAATEQDIEDCVNFGLEHGDI